MNPDELTGQARTHIVDVPDPACALHKYVIAPFLNLRRAAMAAGFDLVAQSSFRDFSRQLAIWNGKFSGERPLVTGSAHLRSVHAQVIGLNAPLEVLTADLTIDSGAVTVQNLSAVAADSNWRGSLRISRPCPKPDACEVEFKLHSDKLNASAPPHSQVNDRPSRSVRWRRANLAISKTRGQGFETAPAVPAPPQPER